jgi:hypothetical protein
VDYTLEKIQEWDAQFGSRLVADAAVG